MPVEAPIRLFTVLLDLLQAGSVTEATVRQRLKPLTKPASQVRARIGRQFLTLGGEFFQLTATFEGPQQYLYEVTLWVMPPAFAAIKGFARASSAQAAQPESVGQWRNSWLGLAPHLLLRPVPTAPKGVSAYFLGFVPGKKVIVLTRR